MSSESSSWLRWFRKKNTPTQTETQSVEDVTDEVILEQSTAQLSDPSMTHSDVLLDQSSDNKVPNNIGMTTDETVILQEETSISSLSTSLDHISSVETEIQPEEIQHNKEKSFFERLKSRLTKTRQQITEGLSDLIGSKKQIDDEVLELLETRLLMADVGVEATQKIINALTLSVQRKELADTEALLLALEKQMTQILLPVAQPLIIDRSKSPYVVLIVGVNGVGKTTTIGKLAKQFQMQGLSVLLAAGDTFRAAAIEQLKAWGEHNNVPVVAQKHGADPASVIFDAIDSAKAKNIDVVIADTAGRLHTQDGLMQELAKIYRVVKKHDETAPHEVMLIVDASTGQNALNQAQAFHKMAPLSGISLTKLDGSAKGGIILAIAEKMQLPIRYIGVGEGVDDLRTFKAEDFTKALVNNQVLH